jgi:hypothetical protein
VRSFGTICLRTLIRSRPAQGNSASQGNAGDNTVPKEKALKPENFPIHRNQKEVVTGKGKPIAGTRDKETRRASLLEQHPPQSALCRYALTALVNLNQFVERR